MKVTVHELVKDKTGSHYISHVEERHYPTEGQGRHNKICEMCGFSTYPECMKHCQNGNGSRG